MCVRPRHLAWIVGRSAERRALAETDGYLSLPGVPVHVDHARFGMPHMVRLAADGPGADSTNVALQFSHDHRGAPGTLEDDL